MIGLPTDRICNDLTLAGLPSASSDSPGNFLRRLALPKSVKVRSQRLGIENSGFVVNVPSYNADLAMDFPVAFASRKQSWSGRGRAAKPDGMQDRASYNNHVRALVLH